MYLLWVMKGTFFMLSMVLLLKNTTVAYGSTHVQQPFGESGSLSRVTHWELNFDCLEQNFRFEEIFLIWKNDVMVMEGVQAPFACFIYISWIPGENVLQSMWADNYI